jgi:hypothetical protein
VEQFLQQDMHECASFEAAQQGMDLALQTSAESTIT